MKRLSFLVFPALLSVSQCNAYAGDQNEIAEFGVPVMPSDLVDEDIKDLNACISKAGHIDIDNVSVEKVLDATKNCISDHTKALATVSQKEAVKQMRVVASLKLTGNTRLQIYLELFYENFGELLKAKKHLPQDLSKLGNSDLTVIFVDTLIQHVVPNIIASNNANIANTFEKFGTNNPQVIATSIVQNALLGPENVGFVNAQIVRLNMH